jgi:hypothetical protein
MTVVSFPGINYNDVPQMLRELADQLEGGAYGEIKGLVYAFLNDGADVYTNTFGKVSPLEACGMLSWASTMIQSEIE